MKKITAFLLAAIMSLSMVACGGGNDTPAVTPTPEQVKEDVPPAPTPTPKPNNDAIRDEDITIENQVIYDKDGVKITATGIDMKATDYSGTKIIKILATVENNSEYPVMTYMYDGSISVNGYRYSGYSMGNFETEVGETKEIYYSISRDNVKACCGSDVLAEIEFRLQIVTNTNGTVSGQISNTTEEKINIKTSIYDIYVDVIEFNGSTGYRDENIMLAAEKIVDENSGAAAINVYAENYTDKDVKFTCYIQSINGVAVEDDGTGAYAHFSFYTPAGKKIIGSLNVPDEIISRWTGGAVTGIKDINTVDIEFICDENMRWVNDELTDIVSFAHWEPATIKF